MTRPTVYLETSVVGYASSRPSRDIVIAARQQLTQDWISVGRRVYELFVSQLVIRETSAGHPDAARERLRFVQEFSVLAITDSAGELAATLTKSGAVPGKAPEDALHIGVAAVHGVEFLLTWNCKHIANAMMRQRIESVCRDAGYEPPVICTPEELIHDEPS